MNGTSIIFVTAMTNGGYASTGSDHDNIEVGVVGKEYGIDHWDLHRHIGNTRHSIAEEVGVDNLPV